MHDHFQTLPSEVILCVVESLWDLPTLGYLVQASPRCAAVFDEHHVQIMRLFISDLPDPLPRLLVQLSLSQKDLTRQNVESYPDIEHFVDSYMKTYTRERPQISEITISLPASRQVVRSACTIQKCAQAFFETFLKRMNTLQPSHMFEPTPSNCIRLPKYDSIVGKRYQIAQCGCASWIEEQKVLRILWQIHIYFTIKAFLAFENDRGTQNWTFLDHEKPSRIWAIAENDFRYVQESELDCVYDYLAELEQDLAGADMRSQTLNGFPMVSLEQILTSQPRPTNDEISKIWQRTEAHLCYTAPALKFFFTTGRQHPGSYLQTFSFRPFQRLGFSIWGLEKMVLWEMIATPLRVQNEIHGRYRVMSRDDVLYTWRSICSNTKSR